MPDRSWTLLGSRYVADYKLIRLREDRYRFEPTQAEGDFIVCESSDWVLVIAITPDRQIVLITQYRHGVGGTVLEVPGGVIDAGESPEVAAARELQEETGYAAETVRYVGRMIPNPAINTAHCHVVVAEGCRLAGATNPDPFEQIDAVLYPLDDVPNLIADGQFTHALAIAAIARYGRIVFDHNAS